jgi:O-antigen/teichoic acid export membrane protein
MALRVRHLLDRDRDGGGGNPLPEGTLSVGGGLLAAGVTSYGFIILASRVVGPSRHDALSSLWALIFLAAPGFFFPLEQEVGRALAARRARGVGGGPLLRRAGLAAGVMALVLLAASVAAWRPLTDNLFDGQDLLLVSFLIGIVGYAIEMTCRGALSGSGRFRPYGLMIGTEGVFRMVFAVVLAVVGVESVGAYGLLIGLAPFAALVVALPGQRSLVTPGPDAPWSELSTSLGVLLAASVLSQLLVNAGPLAVKVLDPDSELAGHFLNGVLLTRVPLFLFQAVQAALLPKLAGLAAAGRRADFRTGLIRLLLVVGAIGFVGTIGAFLVGPPLLRLLFGAEFDLGRRDLTMLAAASSGIMLCQALSQALVALHAQGRAAAAWAAAVAAFVVVTALGNDLLFRVEAGLVAGSAVGVVLLGGLLAERMRRHDEPPLEALVEAISPEHEIVEP